MYWRLRGSQWTQRDPQANRERFHDLICSGEANGVLAYAADQATGWAQVGPREHFARIQAAPSKPALDDLPTWSLNCLFIRRDARGQGLSTRLIRAATELAFARGAQRVEGYPVTPGKSTAAAFLYTGTTSAFAAAGFAKRSFSHLGKTLQRWTCEPPATGEAR